MRILLFSALIISLFPHTGYNQNFKSIVAFGDSFSDNGHIDGYGFNRDTNGYVWVEHLAEMIDCQELDNRAWGGARTDNGHYLGFDWSGFNCQIDDYKMTTDPKEILYTVWIGVNDYCDNKDAPSNSVGNIKKGLTKLIGKGAKYLVVFNNFDLTISLGYGPDTEYHDLVPEIEKLTKEFNEGLSKMLFDGNTGLVNAHPNVKIYFIDIYSFMNDLVNKNEYIKTPWRESYKYPDPKEYLWYDEWHPMTSCHYEIAGLVLKELKK